MIMYVLHKIKDAITLNDPVTHSHIFFKLIPHIPLPLKTYSNCCNVFRRHVIEHLGAFEKMECPLWQFFIFQNKPVLKKIGKNKCAPSFYVG
jgi:hypothetical protein